MQRAYARSPTCQLKRGLCRYCYSRSGARRVNVGGGRHRRGSRSASQARLAMRTFHTGGGGERHHGGLPRVEELFERACRRSSDLENRRRQRDRTGRRL
jgi:hypothetical protein